MSAATHKLDTSLSDAEGLISSIEQSMARLDNLSFEERRTLDAEIDRKIANLESTINQMTAALRNIQQASTKEYYQDEIKALREQLAKINDELKSKRFAISNSPQARQEAQLMSNADRSKAVTNQLDEAIRLGNDTLTVGSSAMATLIDDRRLLEHVDVNIDNIKKEGEKGEKTAKSMLKRACFNGLIGWIICLLLAALLAFSLYWRFK